MRIEILPEDEVHLKPLFGLKPGQWLLCLYILVALIVLFFILLFPGLRNPGTRYRIASRPWGAAIEVDGVYRASSGINGQKYCEVFVKRGKHSIKAVMPDFKSKTLELTTGSRAFGSLFYPKTVELNFSLDCENPVGLFRTAATDYAKWCMAGEPGVNWQSPPVLTQAAYRIGPAMKRSDVKASLDETLAEAADFDTTRAGLRDLINAKLCLESSGLASSPLNLLQGGFDALSALGASDAAPSWLLSLMGDASLTDDSADKAINASQWYKAGQQALNVKTEKELSVKERAAFGGLNFVQMSNGLYFAETRVTAHLWKAFTTDEPTWELNSTPQPQPPQDVMGQRGISWYASQAFCTWFTRKYLDGSGLIAGLPSEDEWQAFADGTGVESGYVDMNLWEWCDNGFAPLELFAPKEGRDNGISPEKALRGGLWTKDGNNTATRASLPPDTNSPFVSFRLLLYRP